jgi:hypothetical protein
MWADHSARTRRSIAPPACSTQSAIQSAPPGASASWIAR